jgi:hypothetical protein
MSVIRAGLRYWLYTLLSISLKEQVRYFELALSSEPRPSRETA